jgi:threonine dehydrogenase-like Zn-dependent dehydrogenase
MAKTMRAFVMKRIGEVGFVEKPIPEPGPNDAVVRPTRALVCTSDVHTLRGALGDRHALTLGHEAVGIVARLGAAVTGFKEGDRVAVNAITPCFQCENCQRGYTSQCREMLGGWKYANSKDGCFAEYFHVNDARANLAPIPDAIPDERAVYATDMMSTGFMAAEHARIPLGGAWRSSPRGQWG